MTSWVETEKTLNFFYSVQRKGEGKYEGDGTFKFIERQQKEEDEYERIDGDNTQVEEWDPKKNIYTRFCFSPSSKKSSPHTLLVQYAKFSTENKYQLILL